MAELIRHGIQKVCQPLSQEQEEALRILEEIRKGRPCSESKAEALKLQKEVRRERKKSRR